MYFVFSFVRVCLNFIAELFYNYFEMNFLIFTCRTNGQRS